MAFTTRSEAESFGCSWRLPDSVKLTNLSTHSLVVTGLPAAASGVYSSRRTRSEETKPNTVPKRDSLSCQEPDNRLDEPKGVVISAVTVVGLVTAQK